MKELLGSKNCIKGIVVTLVFACVIWELVVSSRSLFCSLGDNMSSLGSTFGMYANVQSTRQDGAAIAQSILNKAYHDAFSLLEHCTEYQSLKLCFDLILSKKPRETPAYKNANTTAVIIHNETNAPPWWFGTLIRDANAGGSVHAFWHEMLSVDPPLLMCTVEKVATTQWRRVFALLGNSSCTMYNPTKPPCCPFASKFCWSEEIVQNAVNNTRVVFLRDPLERFLSAYLQKCQGHPMEREWCKPTEVFSDRSPKNHMLKTMTQREIFSAYVDVVPLHWDLHFMPQSLHCGGLFRFIQHYDYVGKMDSEFFQDLDRFTTKYDEYSTEKGRLRNIVADVFETRWKKRAKNGNVSYNENQGIETKAPSRVLDYYTARSVRRVLEYTALDYIALNLPVPDWALQMLENDDSDR